MKLEQLNFQKLLNEISEVEIWDLILQSCKTKKDFLDKMVHLDKEEIISAQEPLFLLGSKTPFSKSIKFIPGKCAGGLREDQIKSGEIHRFLAADPVEFMAQVLGETKIRKRTYLVLKLPQGNKVFSWKYCGKYRFLQLSDNQDVPNTID